MRKKPATSRADAPSPQGDLIAPSPQGDPIAPSPQGDLEAYGRHGAAAVLDAVADAVFVMDRTTTIIWGNSAAERLVGVSWEDGAGQSCLDFVHPDDLQAAALAFTSVSGKDVGTPIELRVGAGSEWRLVEIIGSALGDDILMCARDITERRRWEVANDELSQYRSLLQNSSSLTFIVEADGTIRSSSAVLPRLLGHDQEWVEGRSFCDLVHVDDHQAVVDSLAAINDPAVETQHLPLELRLISFDGAATPFAIRLTNLLDDGSIQGIVVTGHDISDRLTAETSLREANSRLAATLESSTDGILVVDIHGVMTSHNQRFLTMWSLVAEQVDGRHQDDFMRLAAELARDPEAFIDAFSSTGDVDWVGQVDVIECHDGRVVERHSLPQRIDGRIVGRVWSFRDVTEQRLMEGRLTHQAYHDALTGLANQARFRNCIAAAQDRHAPFAVLFVDIDEFKVVNDSLGHSAGDSLLRIIAERISNSVRPTDVVARLGGDEFAVLLDGVTSPPDASEVATRLLSIIRQPIEIGAKRITSSASIGIAYADEEISADDLLRNADLAMYTAKRAGKNCSVEFAADMHETAIERLDLEGHLRAAVANDELVVHYQPIYDLDAGIIVAVEALVRWEHPERGLLGPLSFIPFAEECGCIGEIGEYVLRRSVAAAVTWPELGNRGAPAVSVNVSPHQLRDHQLVGTVAELLESSGLAPERLMLEITEGALIKDPATTVDVLTRLRELGVRIAVDDFGTGHSSLAYLHRFPVDILKIDGSFVGEALATSGSPLAKAIVNIATSLGLECIAEGVESQAQADIMQSFGCRLAQGYHLGRPVDGEATDSLLAAAAHSVEHEHTSASK